MVLQQEFSKFFFELGFDVEMVEIAVYHVINSGIDKVGGGCQVCVAGRRLIGWQSEWWHSASEVCPNGGRLESR